MVAEMKCQEKLLTVGGGLTVAKFKDEEIHYAGLFVFVFLSPKCPYIQLAYSLVEFIHPTATSDINGIH